MSELLEEIREICRPHNSKNAEIFVSENKLKEPHEKPKQTSRVPGKAGHKKGDWDPNDIARLLKRWNEVTGASMQRAQKIVSEFPGRTPQALYWKFWALKTGRVR